DGRENQPGEGRSFASIAEAIRAFDLGEITLQTPITVRIEEYVPGDGVTTTEGWEPGDTATVSTTRGRALFNEALPPDYPYVDAGVDKKRLGEVVNDLAERYPKVQVATTLDALKEAGFHWATRSGVTVSVADVVRPDAKTDILDDYQSKA